MRIAQNARAGYPALAVIRSYLDCGTWGAGGSAGALGGRN